MREIVPDVVVWSRRSERHGYDFNGHLIRHPDGNLCIDPVEPEDSVLDEIVAMGATRILLTNRNHTRASNLLRARLGARTAIHAHDRDHARGEGAEIDDALEVGERVGPLLVVGVSGKSPGEVALFWEARKLLFVGDAVIGNPPGRCGLLPEAVMDDPVQLRRSLEDLAALDIETLLMGDGVSILSGAKGSLDALVASFRK
ncbi:MAG: MBL fold metallo-hydrolase [Rhodospirillales bacterium]|nr:MBL fold metallo-hydrolase [Rhodospirillales bacterium]